MKVYHVGAHKYAIFLSAAPKKALCAKKRHF